MAGHNKFSKIKHKKAANDAKKSQAFNKIIRKVTVAVANGDTDPKSNPRLRLAILAAKEVNLPKSRIDEAIKKATSPETGVFKEVRYEGYASGGIGLIVEGLTNNINKTFHEIRLIFTKQQGALGESGSVSHGFQHLGFITYPGDVKSENEMLELALDAGAEDCSLVDDEYEILSKNDNLHKVKDSLEKTLGEPLSAKLIWRPNLTLTADKETTERVLNMIDILEDHDDVQSVYTNLEVPEDLLLGADGA